MSSNPPELDINTLAARRLSMAAAAAERGEQNAAQMSALVSIAASLRTIALTVVERRFGKGQIEGVDEVDDLCPTCLAGSKGSGHV